MAELNQKLRQDDLQGTRSERLPISIRAVATDIPDDLAYRAAMKLAMENVLVVPEPKMSFLAGTPNPALAARQRFKGIVQSAKMDKTIVVRQETLKEHPKYKKRVKSATTFYAHDEYNIAKVGDVVRIVQSRPISKKKKFVLEAIISERAVAKAKRPFDPKWINRPPLVIVSIPEMLQGDVQRLIAHREYAMYLELELEQIRLFSEVENPFLRTLEPQTAGRESSSVREIKIDERGVELELRFSSNELDIQPHAGFVKTFNGKPRLEPSVFRLNSRGVGTAELNLSILSKRSGEVVQSQSFEFRVIENEGPPNAS